jgi:glycosyltransferase involved in cell wall biosynthesis
MQNEMVSVIIPTRNRRTLVKEAIASVMAQDYKSIEIIVHDNSDPHLAIDEKIDGVKIYSTGGGLTMEENWRAAMKKGNGEYLLRLDDDNLLCSNAISLMVGLCKEERLDVAVMLGLYVGEAGMYYTIFEVTNKLHLLGKKELTRLEYECKIESNLCIFKKSLYERLAHNGGGYINILPDRDLGFQIANAMDEMQIRYGYKMTIGGLMRYDYRPRYPEGSCFRFSLIEHLELLKKATKGRITSFNCRVGFPQYPLLNAISYIRRSNEEASVGMLEELIPVGRTNRLYLLIYLKMYEKQGVAFNWREKLDLTKCMVVLGVLDILLRAGKKRSNLLPSTKLVLIRYYQFILNIGCVDNHIQESSLAERTDLLKRIESGVDWNAHDCSIKEYL